MSAVGRGSGGGVDLVFGVFQKLHVEVTSPSLDPAMSARGMLLPNSLRQRKTTGASSAFAPDASQLMTCFTCRN